MKKYIYIFFIFLLFSSHLMGLVMSIFCCQTAPKSNEFKCYTSGVCCRKGKEDEYWDSVGCFDFDIWVEPSSMKFTAGKKTTVNLYVKNLGSYDDNYTIDYNISSGNQALIQVDMSYVSPTGIVDAGTTKTLYPKVTILSSETSGKIMFNATSQGKPEIKGNTTLNVQSGLPVSLPEFNSSVFLGMMILTGIIYFFFKSNH